MNNKNLINKLLSDLKNHSNMASNLYLQKCEVLHALYVREDDISHALGINLEFRKRINETLSSETLGINQRKRLLKKYWQTFLFAASAVRYAGFNSQYRNRYCSFKAEYDSSQN